MTPTMTLIGLPPINETLSVRRFTFFFLSEQCCSASKGNLHTTRLLLFGSTVAHFVSFTMMRPTSGSNPRLSAPRGAGGSSGLSSRSSLQHRRLGRFMLGLSIAVLVYHLTWRYYLAGVNISDTIEIDGKLRTRRKPDKMKKYDHDNQKHIPT